MLKYFVLSHLKGKVHLKMKFYSPSYCSKTYFLLLLYFFFFAHSMKVSGVQMMTFIVHSSKYVLLCYTEESKFVICNCFQTYFPSYFPFSQIGPTPKLKLLVEPLLRCQVGRILKQTVFLNSQTQLQGVSERYTLMAKYYFSLNIPIALKVSLYVDVQMKCEIAAVSYIMIAINTCQTCYLTV